MKIKTTCLDIVCRTCAIIKIIILSVSLDKLSSEAGCEDCEENLAGIAFKLVYHARNNNKGFFSQLFKVPPKLEFGLPTQFSCPVDSFMFLSKSLSVESSSYKSTCMDLHLGLFPFHNVEAVLYIFETCKLKRYCNNINFTNMASVVVWGYIPQKVSFIKMGHFMELLPVSPNNKSLLVATVSKEKYEIQAQLFVVKFSLFDTVSSSTAFINEKVLKADLNLLLFGQYPAMATVIVKQVTSWEKASLSVAGELKNTVNNIPLKLELYIKEHLEMLYNRSIVKINNAKAVYRNSKLQQGFSLKNHLKMNISKGLTDMQFQLASIDLENQTKIVGSIESELQKANNKTQALQRMINDICMIEKCDEICIPREQCSTCVQDVSTLLQSQCNVPCTDPVKLVVTVGYVMAYRYEFVPREFCKAKLSCSVSRCSTKLECETRSVCIRVSYTNAIYEEKEVPVDPSHRCTRPCPLESVTIPVSSECCAPVGCTREQDDNCTRRNEQCSRSRRIIYSELARTQNANAIILQRYDEAKENETAFRLRVEQLRVRKNIVDQRYNDSYKVLLESNLAVDLATAAYEKIQNESNIDQFQKFQASRNARPIFDSLKIKSMAFNATLVSDSPKVLQMLMSGNIEGSKFTFSQAVTVDFNSLEGSLRDAAIDISEDVILAHNSQSKRSLRTQRQTTEQSNTTYFKFQMKCTDLQNIMEYVMNFNESLRVLYNITDSSLSNVTKSRQELVNLINYYTTEYYKPVTINITQLREAFNIVVNTTDTTNAIETYAGLSSEELQNLNIMKEHLNASNDTEINIGTVFLKWQHKMEELHNVTSSAGGHNCIGFTDCLQKITSVIEDILMDSPQEISKTLLQNFPRVSQNLIYLGLLQNGSLQSAIKAVTNFLNLISGEQLMSYWCAKLPVIVDKSDRSINSRENTTIELFCKANSTDYTTYRWRKDGIELPNQRNSTLLVHNARLHDDSGNYTCEVTNQVGTVGSTGTVVDVQQLPWFFLQPENVNNYNGDDNDAIFKSNASGWPYPGFKWFFRCLGCANYIQVPNEDENELVISNPQPHHEGSYFTEAVNEQGSVKSKIVNFMALGVKVLQLSQSFSINFTSMSSNIQETATFGLVFQSKVEMERVEDKLKKTLFRTVNFAFNTIGNISISTTSDNILSISFTVYSKKLSYFKLSQDSLSQRSIQARIDWLQVTEQINELLTTTSIGFSFDNIVYRSDPNSTISSLPRYLCPPGKEVSSTNSFLCGKYF